MARSRPAGRPAQPPRLWDRLLLGVVAVAAIIIALLVRHDRNTSTLTLVLAGLAGLLGILALLLPYLTGLSGSVGGVSLALSFAAAKPEGLSAQVGSLSGHLDQNRNVTVPASGQTALSEVVRGPDVDYAVINLGRGDQWLASRLLLFTVVMQQLRHIQCIVVIAAAGADTPERLVGLVAADDMWRALAWEYPWLEVALFQAWENISTNAARSPGAARVAKLSPDLAEQLYNGYVSSLNAPGPGLDAVEWNQLQYNRGWEHSPLLTGDTLGTFLGGSLDNRAVQRSRSRSRQLAEVLSIEARYVAIVDANHRFISLVDREALLEELAAQSRSGNGNGA
jgi:hypothetical protein